MIAKQASIEAKEFRQKNCSDCHFANHDLLTKDQTCCTYQGEIKTKDGRCLTYKPRQHCFACGICIGPFYMETHPFPVGDKTLCGHCHTRLQKQGYLTLNAHLNIARAIKLMSDGTVEKKPPDGNGGETNAN